MSETITRNDLSAVIKGLRLHEYATETASYSNTSVKGGTFDVWKIGRTVYFIANGNFSSLAAGTSSGWIEYVTLDSQFCPINDVYVDVTGRSNGIITFKIASSGAVTIYNYGSAITSAQNGMVSGSWVTATSTNYISNFQNNELFTAAHQYLDLGQTGSADIVAGNTTIDGNTLPITSFYLAGDTPQTDLMYRAKRTDTNTSIGFGVGTGGMNHGVWSGPLDKWMIHSDGTSVFVNNLPMDRISTSTISEIITPSSSVTITQASWHCWGKVAQLFIRWTNKNTTSANGVGNINNISLGTLVAGKRPCIATAGHSYGDNAGPAWYYIGTNGGIEMGAAWSTGATYTLSANLDWQLCATYLLA